MVYITRIEKFSASHRLYNPNLSEEENFNIYGKCANKNGHGHNYTLEITLKGEIDPKTGYLFDLSLLKKIIKQHIIDKVDHKHLNYDVDFLQNIIPTTENLAVAFWQILSQHLPKNLLYSVKVYETENNIAEYRGE
jgi:6-pyruvoyltetrahydropterin/6-carboxytetrahydropterin synthase